MNDGKRMDWTQVKKMAFISGTHVSSCAHYMMVYIVD